MEDFLLFFAIIAIVVGFLIYNDWQYKKTAYYKVTRNSYLSLKRDKGKFGEYLVFKSLQIFEQFGGRLLFNVYIPKGNNQYTEIDAILVCSKGLFVFESKNYSGWIFGHEMQKSWTQTLPIGKGRSRKERFYNPIMQNASHIRHLKRFLDKNILTRSVIVFSNECTLKNITVTTDNVTLINHRYLESAVRRICNETQSDLLTWLEIDEIYNKLYPCTQLNPEVRDMHAKNIRNY